MPYISAFIQFIMQPFCIQLHIHFHNPLPNNKLLDWSKLKAFADYKLDLAEILRFVLGMVVNIVGKGENAGYQHFLLFPQCFQKVFFQWLLKVGIVW